MPLGIVRESISDQKPKFASILLGAACIVLPIADLVPWFILIVPIAICGIPIIWGAAVGLVNDHDITADVLVAAAIIASIIIGEYEAAAEIAVIMQIGSFLEEATTNHANSSILRLRNMRPDNARLVENGSVRTVSADTLKEGDIIRVLPGERIPADGTVIAGESSVDRSIITGESTPVDISAGSDVSAGTTNMFGSVDIRIDRVGDDSTISRIAKLIDEADAGRSKIVRIADRWAVYIVAIAFTVAVATMLITGDIYRSVTVLVVFCPCALILATPTAIMAAAGNLGRHGILVKDGGALERLSSVDTMLLDKTGTLTTGDIACIDIVSLNPELDGSQLTHLTASVESRSEHPLGRSIASLSDTHSDPEDFQYVPGKGVKGTVDGRNVFVGNRSFIGESCPIAFDEIDERMSSSESMGYSCVMIGVDGRASGYAVLSDMVRPSSRYAIRHIRMLGMRSIILTGDSEGQATRVKNDVTADDVVWECLPSDKLRIVSSIDSNNPCCMIGDGVNDAPSLKRASVGISMCTVNNDVAMEASDIVFMENDLSKLPGLVDMSKRTIRTIKVGILFSMVINISAMALAVMGLIGPVAGALVHNIGSVAVIISAAMLLRYDPWRTRKQENNGCASYRC